MNIEAYLSKIFADAFEKLNYDESFAKVVISTREEGWHFQCNSAMSLAKLAKKPPFIIAEEIIKYVRDKDIFARLEVAKPGFINITLNSNFLADIINTFVDSSKFGVEKNRAPKKVILDFGGPNVAKPMHVGHIRSALLGESLQRLYRFCGDEVVSDVHLGDWGTQMGMLIEAVKSRSPELIYFDETYVGEYPNNFSVTVGELAQMYQQSSKKCKSELFEMEKARKATFELQQGRRGYIALWKHFVKVSLNAIKRDFNELGVNFDLWLGESDSNKYVQKMLKHFRSNNFMYEDNGVWLVDLGKSDMTPLIIIKSDGAIMYGTTDLATLWQRTEDFDPDEVIYVVDKRQSLHFRQIFDVARKTSIVNNKCKLKHIAFGTVNGKDGRPFKTRDGGVMHLSDLITQAKKYARQRMPDEADEQIINQIAMATIKFGDLMNNYLNDYIFDLERFAQYEGKTGPYLLYTVVRAKSIIKKMFGDNYDFQNLIKNYNVLAANNQYEEKLQLKLIQFPVIITKSYECSQPHYICGYIYSLANEFNRFYANCSIKDCEDHDVKNSRIVLCLATVKVMTIALNILGISVPERM